MYLIIAVKVASKFPFEGTSTTCYVADTMETPSERAGVWNKWIS